MKPPHKINSLPLPLPQRLPPQLIPLPQYPQRILPLDIRHLSPITNPRQRAVFVDNQRAHVVQFDGAAAVGHVDCGCGR
jgi:hypothetical protein